MHKKVFFACAFIMYAMVFIISLRQAAFAKQIQNIVHGKIETVVSNVLVGKRYIREIYGGCSLLLSPRELVLSKGNVLVKDGDGFLENFYITKYDISEAEAKIMELRNVCRDNGTEFAYISFPSKSDNSTSFATYGIDTNSEETRRKFLAWLTEHDIHVLDVRKYLERDGYNKKDIFYKTDHHWTAPAGLYGARLIAGYLNDTFGYTLRTDLLDEKQFTYKKHSNIWLGETGRKPSKTWVGVLDDFIEVTPIFESRLHIGSQYGNYDREGDFSLLVDTSGYSGDKDRYTYSAHYSYGRYVGSPTWIHNDNIDGKKILIIKDSFSMVVIPFLALVNSDIAVWDTRIEKTKNGLYQFIKDNNFDLVLVEYTDMWTEKMYHFN